jgi:ABC-type transport system involved in multi-copper enzyme maturation permease subunit
MVIHDTGYHALDYSPQSAWRRIWPLAVIEFRTLFRTKLGLLLFVLCSLPAVGSLGLLMVRMGIWRLGPERQLDLGALSGRADPANARFYVDPVINESYLPFLVLTAIVGSRAISKDRATNALEILWTRGVTPVGYFAGKWLGSFLLLAIPALGYPIVLWLLAVLMAPDWSFLQQTLAFLPGVLLGLFLFTACLSYLAVAFSALTSSPNFASILWVFFIAGTAALGRALARIFRGDWFWESINPVDALRRVVQWLAGTPLTFPVPLDSAAALAAGYLVGVTLLLARRLRLQAAIA